MRVYIRQMWVFLLLQMGFDKDDILPNKLHLQNWQWIPSSDEIFLDIVPVMRRAGAIGAKIILWSRIYIFNKYFTILQCGGCHDEERLMSATIVKNYNLFSGDMGLELEPESKTGKRWSRSRNLIVSTSVTSPPPPPNPPPTPQPHYLFDHSMRSASPYMRFELRIESLYGSLQEWKFTFHSQEQGCRSGSGRIQTKRTGCDHKNWRVL